MTVLKRNARHHTYADYLVWSNTYGDELIDGTAYVREPPAPSRSHQEIVVELCKQLAIALEERPSGVREVWLIDPDDRRVSIYRLEAGHYGRPIVLELRGQTSIAAVPDVTVDWDRLLRKLL